MVVIKKFSPQTHKVKILIYWDSGTGKTTLASTAPNTLFICSENGLLSIADKSPSYVEVKTIDDLFTVYHYLKNNDGQFDTIVIDSISEISKIIKDQLTNNWSKMMQIQERWKYGEKIIQSVRQIINLDYNVVCIIHDQKVIDEDGTVKQYSIAIQWSAKDEIKRYFDIIAYTYIKDGKHNVTVAPNDKLLTKDRTKVLPKDNLYFDLSKWFDLIKNQVKIWEQKIVKTIENVDTLETLQEEFGDDVDKIIKKIQSSDAKTVIEHITSSSTLTQEQKDYFVDLVMKVDALI